MKAGGRGPRLDPLGVYLCEKLRAVVDLLAGAGENLGETFILGDKPLVLLTALESSFQPDTTIVHATRRSGRRRTIPRSTPR
jgi:hypothetical protein